MVELSLITYDADYIYLLQNKHIGYDMENNNVMESYLVRVPRMGGDAQKVYRFDEQVRTYGTAAGTDIAVCMTDGCILTIGNRSALIRRKIICRR